MGKGLTQVYTGLIPLSDLLRFIDSKPETVDLILFAIWDFKSFPQCTMPLGPSK
jgi:hypothetical protein